MRPQLPNQCTYLVSSHGSVIPEFPTLLFRLEIAHACARVNSFHVQRDVSTLAYSRHFISRLKQIAKKSKLAFIRSSAVMKGIVLLHSKKRLNSLYDAILHTTLVSCWHSRQQPRLCIHDGLVTVLLHSVIKEQTSQLRYGDADDKDDFRINWAMIYGSKGLKQPLLIRFQNINAHALHMLPHLHVALEM